MGALIIFVVVPLVVVGPIIWFVSRQARNDASPVLTSDVLATGEPAQAEITAVKSFGGFLDTRPMVRFGLRVAGADGPYDIDATQSVPRRLLRDLHPGSVVHVRVTADHASAALVL